MYTPSSSTTFYFSSSSSLFQSTLHPRLIISLQSLQISAVKQSKSFPSLSQYNHPTIHYAKQWISLGALQGFITIVPPRSMVSTVSFQASSISAFIGTFNSSGPHHAIKRRVCSRICSTGGLPFHVDVSAYVFSQGPPRVWCCAKHFTTAIIYESNHLAFKIIPSTNWSFISSGTCPKT